jgi:O-acetylserine/cysteine efflux transporter
MGIRGLSKQRKLGNGITEAPFPRGGSATAILPRRFGPTAGVQGAVYNAAPSPSMCPPSLRDCNNLSRHADPLCLALKSELSPRDLVLALAVVAVWGYTFVPIKVALTEVPPFALAALRFLLAAVPLVFFVSRPAMPWRYVIGYGLAIGVFQFGLLFLGMKLGMPAGLSSLVIQVQVFFTILLAVALEGDRLRWHNTLGAVIAFAGILLLARRKLLAGPGGTFAGFVLVIAAAFAWAVGNIIAKRGAGTHAPDMFALVVWSSLVPPLPLAALSFAFEGGAAVAVAVVAMSATAWACVLIMAYGATLFGFASWNALLHRYPTALISPFALLIPVSGLASGALFLDESLAVAQAAGTALVLAGLAVSVYGPRARTWIDRG